jgi:uracil-DNA glycosylase
MPAFEDPISCTACPRLAAHLTSIRQRDPDWHALPVPAFGSLDAELLVVGLGPGERGANRTGRPFTGDVAGELLYPALHRFGFASVAEPLAANQWANLAMTLDNCRITNAVRCAPPGNKPLPVEEATCRPFLTARIAALPRLKVIVTLGDVSRRNVLKALGLPGSAAAPGHGVEAALGGYVILNSYHCSRLNTNTGRLTPAMFEAIFRRAREIIDS